MTFVLLCTGALPVRTRPRSLQRPGDRPLPGLGRPVNGTVDLNARSVTDRVASGWTGA
jgi:hypothetical protein